MHSMRMNLNALYAGISWLKQSNNWNSFSSLSDFSKPLRSHAQHIQRKCIQRKQNIHEHISNIPTEKQHHTWIWIKDSLLLTQICTWVFFTNSLLALSSFSRMNEFWILLQCTKEGVYIRFPSRKLKLSNLDLNIYLPALNLLNASTS